MPVSCLANAHPTSIKPRDETPNFHIQTRDDDDGMITTRAHQMITHVALVVVKPVSHIKGLPRAASPLRPPLETERPPLDDLSPARSARGPHARGDGEQGFRSSILHGGAGFSERTDTVETFPNRRDETTRTARLREKKQ